MIRRALLLLVVAGALAAVPVAALAGNGNGPQPMIWVCHFAGNTAPASWSGGGTTLSGDYVINNPGPSGPAQNQIDYCTSHGGLGIIQINAAAAVNGHGHGGIQLTDRISQYG